MDRQKPGWIECGRCRRVNQTDARPTKVSPNSLHLVLGGEFMTRRSAPPGCSAWATCGWARGAALRSLSSAACWPVKHDAAVASLEVCAHRSNFRCALVE